VAVRVGLHQHGDHGSRPLVVVDGHEHEVGRGHVVTVGVGVVPPLRRDADTDLHRR
jgi:hypothetical protein